MATCIICRKRIKYGDNYTRLLDGKCCSDCWRKSGLVSYGKEYSSTFVRHAIDRWGYIELASQKLKDAYKCQIEEKQLQRNGFNDDNYFYATTLGGEEYGYKILNNTLFQIENEYDYIKRHDLSGVINTASDLKTLGIKKLNFLELPVDNIQYFAKEGSVQYSTQVSGGGGGGSSISGAIIGGIIAGGAGAIIGSRRAADPIASSTTKHDNSTTTLSYFDGDSYQTLVFKGSEMYDFLLKNFPEKEIRTIQLQGGIDQNKSSNEKIDDFAERLEKLKKLYEAGLIDEDEYNNKKQQILAQL